MSDETTVQEIKAERFKDAESVYEVFSSLMDDEAQRAVKRAVIRGMIDGNPPYNPAELKRLKQSYRANVSLLEGEGILDARRSNYYDLLMETEYLVNVTIDGRDSPADDGMTDYGQIISKHFSAMLKEWRGFYYNMMLHMDNMILFGHGNVYWPKKVGWKFKAAHSNSFLIPEGTKANIEDVEIFFVRDTMRMQDLIDLVDTPERAAASERAGWNQNVIKHLLVQGYKGITEQDEDYEEIQKRIRSNSMYYSQSKHAPLIHIAHCFYVERDGKVNHVIISEDADVNKTGENPDVPKFLYRSDGVYKSMAEATVLFMLGIGDGTYHGVRGLGRKIYSFCSLSDRMMNTAADGAMAAATIWFHEGNEAGKQKLRMTRRGNITIIPNGWNPIDFRQNINIQDLLSTKGGMDMILNRNIGTTRPDISETKKAGVEQTLGAFKLNAMRESMLAETDTHLYYIALDQLYQNTAIRMLKSTGADPDHDAVKQFMDRCLRDGVPEDYLTADKLVFKASRTIGFGSPMMRQMIASDILALAPYYDEPGKRLAVRDFVATRANYEAADRYIPLRNRTSIPVNEHSVAALENNDMTEGQECLVGADQNHVVHGMIHMQAAMAHVQMLQEGTPKIQDPRQFAEFLQLIIMHVAQHLDFIKEDPARVTEYGQLQQALQELMKSFQQILKIAQQVQKQEEEQVQAQQEALARAQQMEQSQELQKELAKIQADLQLRMAKLQANHQLAAWKAERQMEIKEATARHEAMLKEMQSE
jgi:hypothetical protein